MWAGYLALTNQQAAANGDPAPGFINPAIYPLSLGSTYSTLFHDITSGSNGFPAVAGYDLVTGWGSPNGSGLINALAPASTGSFTLSVSPSSITITQGSVGRVRVSTTVSGGFDSAIALSANSSSVKFSVNPIPAPGSGASTMGIMVGSSTPVGNHRITVTGTGGGLTQSATVNVTVVAP